MSKTWYGHHIDTIKGEDYVLFKDYLELDKQLEKYKLILKALHKHFTEHECYEINEFLRQLENCTENDMIWLKRMAGVSNE